MNSANLFQSETETILKLVRPFQVHGAGFVEIGFSLPSDPPESLRRARIGDNLIYSNPKPGDRVKISILLGNVTRVRKLE